MTDLAYAPYLRSAMEAFAEDHDNAVIRYAIALCDYCEGRGTETLRGIDVTSCVAEDPDFGFAYAAGDYDDRCSDCRGYGRYYVLSDEDATAEAHSYFNEWMTQVWENHRLERQECGYAW